MDIVTYFPIKKFLDKHIVRYQGRNNFHDYRYKDFNKLKGHLRFLRVNTLLHKVKPFTMYVKSKSESFYFPLN